MTFGGLKYWKRINTVFLYFTCVSDPVGRLISKAQLLFLFAAAVFEQS